MNIAITKIVVGFVSIALVATTMFTAPTAHAQQSASDLQAQINALLAQLSALNSSTGVSAPAPTVVPAAGSVGNAACPYTWTRNLSVGSTGDDVRQLQRFLNGNPQTRVAVSGAGSPGNETSYYGPATGSAVSKFQELHAAQILAPLGLSRGTGGFYTSTRRMMNEQCQTRPVANLPSPIPPVEQPSTETPERVTVTGSGLAVSPGNQPADSAAQKGALRVPFTVFNLTAGSRDVQVSGVKVRLTGLTERENFSGVALTDTTGILYGSTRDFNSRDEATVGGSFTIPRNSSRSLVVVGNITNEDADFNGSGWGSIEVTEIVTDSPVQGNLPISGSSHGFTDAVELQEVTVDVKDADSDIELGRDAEVVHVEVSLRGGSSNDEARLRSLTLTQNGNADEAELGDMSILVDGDEVRANIFPYRDEYTITFPGEGQLIEHSGDVEITLVVNTDTGSDETVQFAVEDVDDVYVVGTRFGYGLPVSFRDATEEMSEIPINSGDITRGSRVRDFDDSVTPGDDVVLAVRTYEFEGEDVEFEDLRFKVTLSDFDWTDADDNSWETADTAEVTLDNLELYVDDRRVSYASDVVEFVEPSSDGDIVEEVHFEETFVVAVQGDRDVRFEIHGDLDPDWADFDGADLVFELFSVQKAEGLDSETNYENEPGNPFNVSDQDRSMYEHVTISGNAVDFVLSDRGIDDESYVSGSEEVVFGTLEVDARDSSNDVELEDFYVTFAGGGSGADGSDLDFIDGCVLVDDNDDRVADARSLSSGASTNGNPVMDQARFSFDHNVVVEADAEAEFNVVCDISDKADVGQQYYLTLTTDDTVEYTIGTNDYTFAFEDDLSPSDTISIVSTGVLKVEFEHPGTNDDAFYSLAVGEEHRGVQGHSVVEVTLEAEMEDVQITDIYLTGVTVGGISAVASEGDTRDYLEKVVESVEISLTGERVDDRDYDNERTVSVDLNDDGDESDTVDGVDETRTLDRVLAFEDIDGHSNAVIPVDAETRFTIDIDFNGITDNRGLAGGWVDADSLVIVYEGEVSGRQGIVEMQAFGNDFARVFVYPTIPSVSTRDGDRTESTGDSKLYELTVSSEGVNGAGDIYLGSLGFILTTSTGTTVSDLFVREGGTAISDDSASAPDISAGATETESVVLSEPERISAGSSKTFELWGTIGGTWDDDSSIVVELARDSDERGQTVVGQAFSALSSSNFVWSPNTLELDGDKTSANTDWFDGYGVFDRDDIDNITVER